jgi:hypothetical protein
MWKGSSSLTTLRWSDEESELEDRWCQKPGFSAGAGCAHVSAIQCREKGVLLGEIRRYR